MCLTLGLFVDGGDVFLMFLITTFLSFAEPETESQIRCREDAESKAQILEDAKDRCRWVVPTGGESDNAPGCTGLILVGREYRPRESTWTGSGHNGHLMCESPYNEKENSYVDNQPQFAFTCSICTTANSTPQLDDECIRSMKEREVALCEQGVPRMRYRYELGRDPIPVSRGSSQ